MEMKAAVQAEVKVTVKATAKAKAAAKAAARTKATARATVRTDQRAWHPQGALLPEAVMPGKLAAQAGPAWAIPAQDVTSQASARVARRQATRLLVECDG
jgi:hypothetical protein